MKISENMCVCAKTVVGLKRVQNEDSYLTIDSTIKDYDTARRGMMFAIADGMGGHSGGDIASKMACEGLVNYYVEKRTTDEDISPSKRLSLLEKVIRSTHNEIRRYAEENKRYAGMGSTLSVLVLAKDEALLAHVGDSRVYRLRNDCLEQLTEDHTMAQLVVEMGYFEPKEAAYHPLRHVLVQAIGQGLDEVQTRIEKVEAGDIFLLCSDGLYGVLEDGEIKGILRNHPADHSACDRLIQTALDKGGQDDVTVIIVQV